MSNNRTSEVFRSRPYRAHAELCNASMRPQSTQQSRMAPTYVELLLSFAAVLAAAEDRYPESGVPPAIMEKTAETGTCDGLVPSTCDVLFFETCDPCDDQNSCVASSNRLASCSDVCETQLGCACSSREGFCALSALPLWPARLSCEGRPTPCGAITSSSQCAQNPGCSWNTSGLAMPSLPPVLASPGTENNTTSNAAFIAAYSIQIVTTTTTACVGFQPVVRVRCSGGLVSMLNLTGDSCNQTDVSTERCSLLGTEAANQIEVTASLGPLNSLIYFQCEGTSTDEIRGEAEVEAEKSILCELPNAAIETTVKFQTFNFLQGEYVPTTFGCLDGTKSSLANGDEVCFEEASCEASSCVMGPMVTGQHSTLGEGEYMRVDESDTAPAPSPSASPSAPAVSPPTVAPTASASNISVPFNTTTTAPPTSPTPAPVPTLSPTLYPTASETNASTPMVNVSTFPPTATPSGAVQPTASPVANQTFNGTGSPSTQPTASPSKGQTATPTSAPTHHPTLSSTTAVTTTDLPTDDSLAGSLSPTPLLPNVASQPRGVTSGFLLSNEVIMIVGLVGGAVLGTLVGLVVCLSWKLRQLKHLADDFVEGRIPNDDDNTPHEQPAVDTRRPLRIGVHNPLSFISLITDDDEYTTFDGPKDRHEVEPP